MKINSIVKNISSVCFLVACAGFLTSPSETHAADGKWATPAGGLWSATGNWEGGIVADGVDNTAHFTNDINATATVELDSLRTIGNVVFSDADPSSAGGWILGNNSIPTNILTLSGATPTITVSNLAALNNATINAVINGAGGLTKRGDGELALSASANHYGQTIVREGTLRWLNPTAMGTNTQTTIITLDGGTLKRGTSATRMLMTLNVVSTGLLDNTAFNNNWNGPLTGSGTLSLAHAGQFTIGGGDPGWNSLQLSNFTGTLIVLSNQLRLDPANNLAFGAPQATWDLGNINGQLRSRFSGTVNPINTTFLGALKGGPGTVLEGSVQADLPLNYQIGDKNLSTTFEGRIQNGGNNPNRRTLITKSGTGTLTLTGTNFYTGDTTVSSGTLAIGATGSIAASARIVVLANGTFDVSAGTYDGVSTTNDWTPSDVQTLGGNGVVTGNVAAISGTISPGTSIGTLRFANNLTLSGSVTNLFEIGSSSGNNDQVNVAGNLTLNGTTVVRLVPAAGFILNGSYSLFKWDGTLTGDAGNLSLEHPVLPGTFVLQTNLVTREIVLQVSGVVISDLLWRGDAGADWDIGVTTNWRTNGIAIKYADFNHVIFDDTGANAAPVNLVDQVFPLDVRVDAAQDYVITTTGSGKISGVTGLVKNGTGKLTLTLDNDYTGSTLIGQGTLQVGNGGISGSVGSGPLVINTNGILVFNRSDTVTYAGSMAGAGTLVQNGTNGTLILTGDNTNGGVLVRAGTVQLGDGTSIQGSVTATITNNATLNYLYDLGDVTVKNGLSGTGTVNFAFTSGSRTYTLPVNATNVGFTGTINLNVGVRLHADNGNAGFNLGNGSHVNVPSLGQVWIDSSATNYNQSFTIAGNGWSGDLAPDTSPGLGALRLFNCTLTGPITMAGDSRIAGSSTGARIEGPISGDGYQLEVFNSGPNVDQFVLTLAPASGTNTWGTTLVTRGVLQAGNTNAISTNAVTITGEGRLRLNGNNISLANLYGGTPVNGTNCLILNMNTTNPATLTVGADGNSSFFEGIFGDGASQPLGLTKVGGGTFTLNAVNSNTGPVTVTGGTLALTEPGSFDRSRQISAGSGAFLDVNGRSDQTLTLNNGQTLKGNGTVSGNVNALAGSTINPGTSVGSLNVSGNLTLSSGALLIELNRTNGSQTNDLISVSGSFTSTGGALLVTNIGPALAPGNFFQLFSAGRAFASVLLQTNDTLNNVKYTWLDTVASNGRITVQSVSSLVNTTPTNITFSVTGGDTLDLSWPEDHTGWTLQTNAVSVANPGFWFEYPAGTGSRNTNHVTYTIDRNKTNVFFRLVYP